MKDFGLQCYNIDVGSNQLRLVGQLDLQRCFGFILLWIQFACWRWKALGYVPDADGWTRVRWWLGQLARFKWWLGFAKL
jgi:hypothetical protein